MGNQICGKALIEIFQERPNRLDLARKGLRLGGIERLKFANVLEVGCGFGEATIELSEEFDSLFVGVDFEERHIEIAKERQKERESKRGQALFIVRDAIDLKLPENVFDFILSEAAFSLLLDKEKAASEYARVLKAGGKLVLNDFVIRGQVEEDLQKKMPVPCFRGMGKAKQYIEIITSKGFRIVRSEDCSKELYRMAMHLRKSIKIENNSMDEILNKTPTDIGGGQNSREADFNAFLKTAKMGYYQLILEKI